MEMEVFYFENGRGGVALSVDDKEHVIISNGRVLTTSNTVWEESSEDLENKLSAIQKEVLTQAYKDFTELGDVDEVVAKFRKLRLKEERNTPTALRATPYKNVRASALVVNAELDGENKDK